MERERALRMSLIPSVADLFFITIFLLLFFTDKSRLLADGDTGYHIRAGEYMIATDSVPAVDIFSFHTPALPWTAHEWLSEIIMASIHAHAGLTGIVAFFSFLLALSIYLLCRILRSYGTDMVVCIAITTLVLASSQIHWLARPHVFSLLLMVVFHYLLESWHRERKNRLYLLPPLMLLWVNLHGGFLGGFILLGAYLAGSLTALFSRTEGAKREIHLVRIRQLAVVIGACLVMSLINPRGYQILLFPFKLISDGFIMDHVAEFVSPNFHRTMPFKYLLLFLVAILALSRKGIEATELVLVLIFTNMSLYSARYIPLFALITAPLLTRKTEEARGLLNGKVGDFLDKRSGNIDRLDRMSVTFLWPAITLVVVATAIHSGKIGHTFDDKIKPVAAAEFLMRERIAGNVFNNDEFGDYLIYRGYPSYRVFFDGRSDMYGSGVMKEYYRVVNFEPGWSEILDRYRITWIFFDSNSPLSRYLLTDREWVLIYSDKVADIFVKDIPQYRGVIERHRGVKQAEPEPEKEPPALHERLREIFT